MQRRPHEPRWRVGEEVRLQPHLDLTRMGAGVILDVEAKADGVAKAALVRFEGGPRAGLWYSIGSLEHVGPLAGAKVLLPSFRLKAKATPEEEPSVFDAALVEATDPARLLQPDSRQAAWLSQFPRVERPRQEPSRGAPQRVEAREPRNFSPWSDRLLGVLARMPHRREAESLCTLLGARGASEGDLTTWIEAVKWWSSGREIEVIRSVRANLESRPLWRWDSAASWLRWLFPNPNGQVEESSGDEEFSREGPLLDGHQLTLRGWLFPGERMRALLAEFEAGVEGVETEREALTWAMGRLRELGWWRPLRLASQGPDLLSPRALADSVGDVLPGSTQSRVESLLRGAQRAGLVRSPSEAAAWVRAWIENEAWKLVRPTASSEAEGALRSDSETSLSRTSEPAERLPEPIEAWELIRRGWLLDPVRIRALRAKEERARERREPKYLASPLAWAYCQVVGLSWLRPRRPSLAPIDLSLLGGIAPRLARLGLLAALRQVQSAGIVRDAAERSWYASAWIEQDRARRLQAALDEGDLPGALATL